MRPRTTTASEQRPSTSFFAATRERTIPRTRGPLLKGYSLLFIVSVLYSFYITETQKEVKSDAGPLQGGAAVCA